jgi:enoyl-[acyl-carrier protein] reductase I
MALLEGKKALVTGVANKNSIAWGIARSLHRHGASIGFMCLPTNVGRLKRLAHEVESDIIGPCDVLKDDEMERGTEEVVAALGGRLDVLIHSIAFAELADLEGEFIGVSRAGWNLALEVSAYSLVALARCARTRMRESGGGAVVTLTFYGGTKVIPNYNIMGVAKAALDASLLYLAYDLGPDNIRVNAISAGPIQTPSSMVIHGFPAALKRMESSSPLLRNVTREQLGSAAVYLASELSGGVTGHTLYVDSGMNILGPAAEPHRRWKMTPAAE